jgi:hypothetical protein
MLASLKNKKNKKNKKVKTASNIKKYLLDEYTVA